MFAAVAQICSSPSIARNLAICKNVIDRAAKSGAKLVYLPEASDYIAPTAEVYSLSSTLESSAFVQVMKDQAKESSVWVGVGVHERPTSVQPESKRVFNTHLLINPQGEIKARYEKLHLFDVDQKRTGGPTLLESNTTIPGKGLVRPVATTIGNVGLLTCYDIRFPEASLLLRHQGADVLTYPSAFTLRTGQAHWETLLRARAIETQSYVLAPAQIGEHFAGRFSYGKAMIIDPWGTVVAQCNDDPSAPSSSSSSDDLGRFCLADIDLDWLGRIRREMPLWEQRRNDIYSLSVK